MRWSAADEGRHDDVPGLEGWGFEFACDEVVGRILVSFDTAHGHAGYLADLDLGEPGRIVVADGAVGLPRRGAGLDLRADGLWSSFHCETPFEHWSLGLEAFGLRVDEADRLGASSWDDLRGERVAVGFDLEWELRQAPGPLADGEGYIQAGVIFGEVLLERDRLAVEGPSVREHWWGGVRRARHDGLSPRG